MHNIIDINHIKHFNFLKVEEYDYCDYYIDKQKHVVFINFTRNVMFTVEMGKALFYKAFEFFPTEKVYVIISISEKTQLENGALDFISSEERCKKVISDAFIIKSTALKFVSNFYLRIKNPKIHTKVFNELDEAFDWTADQMNLFNLAGNL